MYGREVFLGAYVDEGHLYRVCGRRVELNV